MKFIGWLNEDNQYASEFELGGIANLEKWNETEMDFEDQKTVLSKLLEIVDRLQAVEALNPIVKTSAGKFRHRNKTDKVYLFMKALRYVSLLNSARVLTENGFFQEVGIICRCLNETLDDFSFIALSIPDSTKGRRDQHLDEFYLEEFKPRSTGLPESNKRNRVSRKNIHASLAYLQTPINSSDAIQVHSLLETAYSGYVHGAYGHIMELYGGTDYRFQVNGLPSSAFKKARERSMSQFVYSGILILEHLALVLGETEENQGLHSFRKTIELKWPEFATDYQAALKQAKRRKQDE